MQKSFFYPLFSLLLGAALLLVSCEPTSSSAAPRKKTEALQALEDATGELETKMNAEIDARVKYVKAGGQEIVWLLLR